MLVTINKIIETRKVMNFLIKRRLLKQYKKAKQFILDGNYSLVDLQLRQPKKDRVFYFRINIQYRAWGYLDGTALKVYKIDNHQN